MSRRLRELFAKQRLLIEVDIAQDQVRLVKLSRLPAAVGVAEQGERFRLDGYALGALPSHAVEGGEIQDAAAVSTVVSRLAGQLGVKRAQCALAVKINAATSMITKVDASLSPREIEDLVLSEAESLLPFSLDEVYLDFASLGLAGADHSRVAAFDEQEVQIVACQHAVLDSRVAAMSAARLKVDVVDIESFALERTLALIGATTDEQAVVVVILLEAGTSSVHLFRGGRYTRTREWNRTPAEQPTDAFPALFDDHFALSLENDAAVDPTSSLTSASDIAAQVRKLDEQVSGPSGDLEINQAFLAGSGANEAGLGQSLEAKLLCLVLVSNPFAMMAMGRNLDPSSVDRDAAALLISCGLAVRGVGS